MWSSPKKLESTGLYELDRVDNHRRADEGVTVGNCRTNCLLFADDLVLHAVIFSVLNMVFSTHFIGFTLHATKQEGNSAL